MSVSEWDRLRRNEAGDIVTGVPQGRFRPGFHGNLVAQLSNTDNFKRAVLYAAHDLPAAVGRKLLALIDALNIGIVLGTLGAWTLAHYFGIGEFVDIVLGGTVIATFGWQMLRSLAIPLPLKVGIHRMPKGLAFEDLRQRMICPLCACIPKKVMLRVASWSARMRSGILVTTLWPSKITSA